MEVFIDEFFETLFGSGPWFITAIVFYLCGILYGIWIGFSFQRNKVQKPLGGGVPFQTAARLMENES